MNLESCIHTALAAWSLFLEEQGNVVNASIVFISFFHFPCTCNPTHKKCIPCTINFLIGMVIFSYLFLFFSKKKKSWMVAELMQKSVKISISLYTCINIFSIWDVSYSLQVQFLLPEQLPQAVSLDFHYSISQSRQVTFSLWHQSHSNVNEITCDNAKQQMLRYPIRSGITWFWEKTTLESKCVSRHIVKSLVFFDWFLKIFSIISEYIKHTVITVFMWNPDLKLSDIYDHV